MYIHKYVRIYTGTYICNLLSYRVSFWSVQKALGEVYGGQLAAKSGIWLCKHFRPQEKVLAVFYEVLAY